MQLIKGGSSHEIHRVRGDKIQLWQSGFHESRVTSWTEYVKKRDYISFNPVTAKLVERPELWAFGSASGKFLLDPIPQGLKPILLRSSNVGPEGPTPGAISNEYTTPGLKPRPPKESEGSEAGRSFAIHAPDAGPKGPTPGAISNVYTTPGLKPRPPKEGKPLRP